MDLGNSLETIFIAMTHLNDLKKQRTLLVTGKGSIDVLKQLPVSWPAH